MIQLPKLILASASPRRAEILNAVGWEFATHAADVDETEFPGENPSDYVQRLAGEKALRVASFYEEALVLGADTTVVIDGEIIGKPVDLADARRMLKMLSARAHEVLTGIALVKKTRSSKTENGKRKTENERSENGIVNPKSIVALQRTKVKFAEMNDREIDFLAEKGDPLDKAGAYAVQAQAALFIEEIEGDYWNVVGLPVNLVYEAARKLMND